MVELSLDWTSVGVSGARCTILQLEHSGNSILYQILAQTLIPFHSQQVAIFECCQ